MNGASVRNVKHSLSLVLIDCTRDNYFAVKYCFAVLAFGADFHFDIFDLKLFSVCIHA